MYITKIYNLNWFYFALPNTFHYKKVLCLPAFVRGKRQWNNWYKLYTFLLAKQETNNSWKETIQTVTKQSQNNVITILLQFILMSDVIKEKKDNLQLVYKKMNKTLCNLKQITYSLLFSLFACWILYTHIKYKINNDTFFSYYPNITNVQSQH